MTTPQDDPTAPVTAEDLRAELIAQLNSEPYMTPAETVDGVMVVLDRLGVIDHANYLASSHASEHAAAAGDLRERVRESFGPAMRLGLQDAELAGEPGAQRIEEWITCITDQVVAALAGDPGDLPARMAEAIRNHHTDDERVDSDGDPTYCVCGEIVEDWDDHWAAAAMSVRWEHAASQAAEVEQLRAELGRYHRAAEAARGIDWTNPAARDVVVAESARLRAELDSRIAEKRLLGVQATRLRAGRDEARELARKRGDHVELQSQALDKVLAERDALRARLTGVAIHANRLKTWIDDDKASITIAGPILGDLFAAMEAPGSPGGDEATRRAGIDWSGNLLPETTPDAPTGGED